MAVRAQGEREPAVSRRSPGPPARWRFISDPALPGAYNMALDHALARELIEGGAWLRLYRWERPTLSFGRNEPAAGLYDVDEGEALGVDFVRRPTGGRAVLHDQELTYAVVVEVGAFGGLRETYRRINEALVAGLTEVGAPAELAVATGPVPSVDAGACFDVPADGEVMADGRKLVGSAQVRIGRAILQHGSIILGGDQSVIGRLGPGGPMPAPPATLGQLLGAPPARSDLEAALLEGFRRCMGGSWRADEPGSKERQAVAELDAQYRDPAWTWRR